MFDQLYTYIERIVFLLLKAEKEINHYPRSKRQPWEWFVRKCIYTDIVPD